MPKTVTTYFSGTERESVRLGGLQFTHAGIRFSAQVQEYQCRTWELEKDSQDRPILSTWSEFSCVGHVTRHSSLAEEGEKLCFTVVPADGLSNRILDIVQHCVDKLKELYPEPEED